MEKSTILSKESSISQESFGTILFSYRVRKGYSQAEMAQKLGYSRVWQYQRLERYDANPTLDTICNVIQNLDDLDIEKFLTMLKTR